ncbi:MAG: cell envelope integrity protein TolA [Eubacteriales bacterium]|nr:cell envelope integrity protein TolA [Eubacteriales bacterium]
MKCRENHNFNSVRFDRALEIIKSKEKNEVLYESLMENKEWSERFHDYLKGKKTLPLLYEPFFQVIFNPENHKGRLSILLSSILGQEVTVLEVLERESSSFIGTLVIMDMVVRMGDGSVANIEIQKVPYMFPAERISCYSSDLIMRQYRRLSGQNEMFSYKNMRKVHTIIFFEESSSKLKSPLDKKNYFHVGKTRFNTEIGIELLQEFHLISLDTFRKYRYPNIKDGDIEITEYDYDEREYRNEATEKMKRDRLMFLSLFSVENVEDADKLQKIFPELSPIFHDMCEYMERPEEVLKMFSEALSIMDRNTINLMVDQWKIEVEEAKEEIAKSKAEIEKFKADAAKEKARADKLEAELAKMKALQENNAGDDTGK